MNEKQARMKDLSNYLKDQIARKLQKMKEDRAKDQAESQDLIGQKEQKEKEKDSIQQIRQARQQSANGKLGRELEQKRQKKSIEGRVQKMRDRDELRS